ncbi:MAG: hypothetical protein M3Z25_11050 [Actinomycetota bacterium]|nr:hypothetical protein [Actinomycetota bacterium]
MVGRTGALVAALLALAAVSVVVAPKALAYTSGCTFVDGPAGAHECVNVHGGGGVQVDSIGSVYYFTPNGAATGSNVCDRHHEVSFYLGGERISREIDPPGCVDTASMVATGDFASFAVNANLDPNTPVCARAKNSATNQQWTPYACEKILP